MFFNSQAYLVFFVIVFTIYWLLPWSRARVYLLLAASFTFYAFWSRELALLVASTTVLDYLFARGMDSTPSKWRRRVLLGSSLSMNLGLLCYFKYANFFLDALRDSLKSAGGSSNIPYLEVIVPFGISFYTFEAISYTIDVYSRKIKAERNLPNFMLFILFFPHLVAGPIVRARDFLPQAARPKKFSWLRFQAGIELFLIGLFKKMVIADNMATLSDPVFASDMSPTMMHRPMIWLAVLAFAVRIYCDFSGYCDMALGSAHMLGYKLTINFRAPYFSKNISEFWRRWHISLSNWLRDYLFIPLGGSHGSRWNTARNLMITMALGGLWHGANWSFLIWGLLHGLMLVGHRFFRDYAVARPRLDALLQTKLGTLFRMGLTFFAVSLCWIFFQPSLSRALLILREMINPLSLLDLRYEQTWILVRVGLLLLAQWFLMKGLWKRIQPWLPAPVVGANYAILLVACILMAPETNKTFIYFQF